MSDEPEPEVHTFETTDERNAWIDEHYPRREAANTPPGFYNLPEGGHLGVFMREVTYYPPKPKVESYAMRRAREKREAGD